MSKKAIALKQAKIKIIADQIKASNQAIIFYYHGLNVADLAELRQILRENDAKLKIYQNTLLRFACKADGYDELEPLLVGPNALAWTDNEEINVPKLLYKFAKTHPALIIRTGIIGGQIVDEAAIIQVATLPTKEELLGMFMSCLQSPLRQLMIAIKEVAKTKTDQPQAEAQAEAK